MYMIKAYTFMLRTYHIVNSFLFFIFYEKTLKIVCDTVFNILLKRKNIFMTKFKHYGNMNKVKYLENKLNVKLSFNRCREHILQKKISWIKLSFPYMKLLTHYNGP